MGVDSTVERWTINPGVLWLPHTQHHFSNNSFYFLAANTICQKLNFLFPHPILILKIIPNLFLISISILQAVVVEVLLSVNLCLKRILGFEIIFMEFGKLAFHCESYSEKRTFFVKVKKNESCILKEIRRWPTFRWTPTPPLPPVHLLPRHIHSNLGYK